jgi:hypothetical protein
MLYLHLCLILLVFFSDTSEADRKNLIRKKYYFSLLRKDSSNIHNFFNDRTQEQVAELTNNRKTGVKTHIKIVNGSAQQTPTSAASAGGVAPLSSQESGLPTLKLKLNLGGGSSAASPLPSSMTPSLVVKRPSMSLSLSSTGIPAVKKEQKEVRLYCF